MIKSQEDFKSGKVPQTNEKMNCLNGCLSNTFFSSGF